MKRILALVLAVVLFTCVSGCAQTEIPKDDIIDSGTQEGLYAPERTVNFEGAVGFIDNLKNTYHKLTAEKQFNITYLGGSVTNGTGGTEGYCWRTATTQWFKENFTDAQITETNLGWGGAGSYWGFFRVDESLLPSNPDLVFLEYAINDAYAGNSRINSSLYMEGIIRKIREHNPNCDIVIIFVTDNSPAERLGTEYEQLLGHKDVASFYGIPTINVGNALVKEMQRTGRSWDYYVTDIVHPNNKGYKVYADCIAEQLEKWLIINPDESGFGAHEKPNGDFVDNLSVKSQIVKAKDLENYSGFRLINSKSSTVSHVGEALYGKVGSTLKFEFEGRGLGMLVDGTDLPYAEILVDGKEKIEMNFTENKSEYPILDNLNYGKHTVEITVTRGEKIVIGGFLVAQ